MRMRKKVFPVLLATVMLAVIAVVAMASSAIAPVAQASEGYSVELGIVKPDDTEPWTGGPFMIYFLDDDGKKLLDGEGEVVFSMPTSAHTSWTDYSEAEFGEYTLHVDGVYLPDGYTFPADEKVRLDASGISRYNEESGAWEAAPKPYMLELQKLPDIQDDAKLAVTVQAIRETYSLAQIKFAWQANDSVTFEFKNEQGEVVATETVACSGKANPEVSVELPKGTYTCTLTSVPDSVVETTDFTFRISKDSSGEWVFEKQSTEGTFWEDDPEGVISLRVPVHNANINIFNRDGDYDDEELRAMLTDFQLLRNGEVYRTWKNEWEANIELPVGSYVLRVNDIDRWITPAEESFDVVWQDDAVKIVKSNGSVYTLGNPYFVPFNLVYVRDNDYKQPYDWQKVIKAAIAAIGSTEYDSQFDFLAAIYNEGDAGISASESGVRSLGEEETTWNYFISDDGFMQSPYCSITDIVISPDGETYGIYAGSNEVIAFSDGEVKLIPLTDFWAGTTSDAQWKYVSTGVYSDWFNYEGPDMGNQWTQWGFIVQGDVPEGMDNLSFRISTTTGVPLARYDLSHRTTKNMDGELDPDGTLDSAQYVGWWTVDPSGDVVEFPLSDEWTGIPGVDDVLRVLTAGFTDESHELVLDPIIPDGYGVRFACDYDDTVVADDGTLHINGFQGEVSKGGQGNIIVEFYKLSPAAFSISKHVADPIVYSIDGDKDEDTLYDGTDLVGDQLEGATLAIYNAAGTEIERWISDDRAKSFDLLPGDYTIKEIEAPEGYQAIGDVSIRITDNGRVAMKDWGTWNDDDGLSFVLNQAVFDDIDRILYLIDLETPRPEPEPDPLKVDIVKYGIDATDEVLADEDNAIIIPSSASPVAGAKFTVVLSDGSLIDTWTTGLADSTSGSAIEETDATHTIELPDGVTEFDLVEDEAPAGYETAPRIHVTIEDDGAHFTYGDSDVEFVSPDLRIAILDIAESTPPTSVEPTVAPTAMVKTGDALALILLGTGILAIAAIASTAFIRSRKR